MRNFKELEEAKKVILERIAAKLLAFETNNEVEAQPLRHGAHGSQHISSHSSSATRSHGAVFSRHCNRNH